MKQRFQQVHLSELKEGDRFYFGSKKTQVCQFTEVKRPRIYGIAEYFWTLNGKKDSTKTNRTVVFLRNINS